MAQYVDVFTPDSVIAAALPTGGENAREVAYNNAAYALDREDVHLIYTIESGAVYYIAAASEDFAGHISAVTPLSAALPGMKGHQGDGAYVAIAESGYAVVVKKADEMFSYVGDRQAVDAFITNHDVPTYSVTDTVAQPWEGYNMGTITRATKIARSAIIAGAVFAFVGFLAWFAIASFSADIEKEGNSLKRETEQSLKNAAREINTFATQPVVKDMRNLQDLISISAEVGGFVNFYELKEGKVSWEIELPGWATSDVIDRFGKGLSPSKDEDRNVIIVRKGERVDPRRRRR